MSRDPNPNSGGFRRAVFAGFVVTGIFTVLLGPILPSLIARWSLTDSQAGFFFTAQYAGALLGTTACALLERRLGFRVAILAGYGLMAAGVALLSAGLHPVALLGIFGAGFGNGFVTPASNLVIALEGRGSRAARLNLLNFAWGAGAVSCPLLVAFAERLHGLRVFLWGFAVTLAIFSGVFALLKHTFMGDRPDLPAQADFIGVNAAVSFIGDRKAVNAAPAPAHSSPDGKRGRISRSAMIFLGYFITLFFLYVGTENCFGGWAASFAHQIGAPGGVSALMPLFFYGMLLLGRLMAPAILQRVPEKRVAFVGMLLALVSSLMLLVVRQTAVLAIVLAIGGLGCSMLFPIFIAWMTHFLDESAAGLRTVPFASANFGGASLPWLVGVFSTRFGGLRAAFPLVAISIAMIMLLTALLQRRVGRSVAAA